MGVSLEEVSSSMLKGYFWPCLILLFINDLNADIEVTIIKPTDEIKLEERATMLHNMKKIKTQEDLQQVADMPWPKKNKQKTVKGISVRSYI